MKKIAVVLALFAIPGACRSGGSGAGTPAPKSAREDLAADGIGYLAVFAARVPIAWHPATGAQMASEGGVWPRSALSATPDLSRIAWIDSGAIVVRIDRSEKTLRFPVASDAQLEDIWAVPGERLFARIYAASDRERRFYLDLDLAAGSSRRLDLGPRAGIHDVEGDRVLLSNSAGDILLARIDGAGVRDSVRVGRGFSAELVGDSVVMMPWSEETLVPRDDQGQTYTLLKSDPPDWTPKPYWENSVRTLHGATPDGKWLLLTLRKEVAPDPRFPHAPFTTVMGDRYVFVRVSDRALVEVETLGYLRTWTSAPATDVGTWRPYDDYAAGQELFKR